MNASRNFARFWPSALLLSVMLAACQANERAPERNVTDADRLADLSGNSTFSVADSEAQPLLALQLRFTDAGASVVRSEFVSAPLPTGASDQDFTVMGLAGGAEAHKYAIPDPLEAQVETEDRGLHKTVRLPEALVWVYMPAVNLDSIELAPTREAGFHGPTALNSRGTRIEMPPILQRLCNGGTDVGACARRALATPDAAAPRDR